VHDNGANVIRMCLEGSDLLRRVVIVYAQVKVIRTANDPVFPCNEATSANGDICKFKGLDNCLCFV
jgi:hypothetical protein